MESQRRKKKEKPRDSLQGVSNKKRRQEKKKKMRGDGTDQNQTATKQIFNSGESFS